MVLRKISRALLAACAVALLLALAAPASAVSNTAPFGPVRTSGGSPNVPPPLPGLPGTSPNTPPLLPDRGLVPANVSVAGHDLGMRTESDARSIIHAFVKGSGLPALTVLAGERTYTFAPGGALSVDLDAMLDEAYAANGVDPVDLTPRFRLDARAVRLFVDSIAKGDRKAADARWYVTARRLKLAASAVGQQTDRSGAYFALLASLREEARTLAAQPALTLPVKTVYPRVTEKNIGRAILVTRKEFTLRLYDPANGGGIMKQYKCAVGQPGYPTPLGTFKIIEKRYMPTWVNPAPNGWGANMPAYIGPGPGNPLGTRALNLSVDAIRIHGTENVGSIGTPASRGCVRLVRKNIEELYDLVVVGTPVFIID